jgi:maltose O-acetyltransferase
MIVLDSLKQLLRHLIRDLAFNTLASSVMVPTRVRWVVLRMMGCKVERSRICPRCFISSRRLRVHRGVFVNYNCFFDASDWVTLAENVSIGMGCTFVTSSHTEEGADHD